METQGHTFLVDVATQGHTFFLDVTNQGHTFFVDGTTQEHTFFVRWKPKGIHLWGHPHITPLLTALLPLSVHPFVTPAPHCSPSSVYRKNENGPRQAERHEGSHAQQLGQLANGRAGGSRRPVYKEAFQPTRVQIIDE